MDKIAEGNFSLSLSWNGDIDDTVEQERLSIPPEPSLVMLDRTELAFDEAMQSGVLVYSLQTNTPSMRGVRWLASAASVTEVYKYSTVGCRTNNVKIPGEVKPEVKPGKWSRRCQDMGMYGGKGTPGKRSHVLMLPVESEASVADWMMFDQGNHFDAVLPEMPQRDGVHESEPYDPQTLPVISLNKGSNRRSLRHIQEPPIVNSHRPRSRARFKGVFDTPSLLLMWRNIEELLGVEIIDMMKPVLARESDGDIAMWLTEVVQEIVKLLCEQATGTTANAISRRLGAFLEPIKDPLGSKYVQLHPRAPTSLTAIFTSWKPIDVGNETHFINPYGNVLEFILMILVALRFVGRVCNRNEWEYYVYNDSRRPESQFDPFYNLCNQNEQTTAGIPPMLRALYSSLKSLGISDQLESVQERMSSLCFPHVLGLDRDKSPISVWNSNDGHVNSEIVEVYLVAVVSTLSQHPGISLMSLCQRMCLYTLKECLELIQGMEAAGMISLIPERSNSPHSIYLRTMKL